MFTINGKQQGLSRNRRAANVPPEVRDPMHVEKFTVGTWEIQFGLKAKAPRDYLTDSPIRRRKGGTSWKSDKVIVLMKHTNKASNEVAECVEGRTLTKRNSQQCARDRTQSWTITTFRLSAVRKAAQKYERFYATTRGRSPVHE